MHVFGIKADLAKIMRACIILHNMIVEDEKDTYTTPFGPLPTYDDVTDGLPPPNLGEERLAPYERYIERNIHIRDKKNLVSYNPIWLSILQCSIIVVNLFECNFFDYVIHLICK